VRTRHACSLVLTGLLAGVIVAAIVVPPAALAGSFARVLSGTYAELSADFAAPPMAQRSSAYADDGRTLIATFYDENRRDVPLSQIAPVMRQAVVAAEDRRFYQHGAVDPRGMLRAFVADLRHGGADQGGSTLAMQYVRNVLKDDPRLTPKQRQEATADTLHRKLQEIRYAISVEHTLSKAQILDRYLNIAYFGDGAYGIDAASHAYFDTSPARLTLPEAAMLAGLVQSPDTDNPVTGDRAAALNRRAYVLQSLATMHVITSAQAAAVSGQPLGLQVGAPTRNGCTATDHAGSWGFFCDYLRRWWDAQPQFGATSDARDRALREGGYRIVTSLDPRIQAAAEKQALTVYPYGSPRALPIAVVQPGTGRILAMAVNRHYSLAPNPGLRHYPNTVDPLVAGGGGVVGYQAGSTFKLFTMLAALSSGLPLDTSFTAPAALRTRWAATGPGTCRGRWCPRNDNPAWMDGHRTMWAGYGRSVNTYFVWLEQRVGVQRAVDMARRLGITFRAPADARLAAHPDSWGSFTLGVADTTPLDLAEAYATLADGGTSCAPLPVVSIADAGGRAVAGAQPACHRAIDADVAAAATDAARCPVGQQSAYHRCNGGTAHQVSGIVGRPVAGKTGSSEDNSSETFVGFTPQVAAAGIAADPEHPRDRVGTAVAARVDTAVARTLAAAVSGQPVTGFPVPSLAMAFGPRSSRMHGAAVSRSAVR
jgi:membrane peptidoglycan carboxypeptidase